MYYSVNTYFVYQMTDYPSKEESKSSENSNYSQINKESENIKRKKGSRGS